MVSKRARQVPSQHTEAGAAGAQRERRRRRMPDQPGVRPGRRRSLDGRRRPLDAGLHAAAASPAPRSARPVQIAGEPVRPELNAVDQQRPAAGHRWSGSRADGWPHHDGLRASAVGHRRINVNVRRSRISGGQLLARDK